MDTVKEKIEKKLKYLKSIHDSQMQLHDKNVEMDITDQAQFIKATLVEFIKASKNYQKYLKNGIPSSSFK